MAGIGFQLQKIFRKKSIASTIEGIGYSTMISIGPMLLIIGTLLLIFNIVDYTSLPYTERDLMASTILYAFIFSLMFTSPFNSVLSRYVADKMFEEKFEDILPCFYTGLVLNMVVVTGFAVPFYLWEIYVGKVSPVFVFGSYCMYVSLAIIFYSMLYLSATKDYKIISIYFLTGMVLAVLFVVIMVYLFKMPIPGSVIYGMASGFLITASLEFSYLKKYFYVASNNYKGVFLYFKRFYKIFFSNLFYTLGLFIHNFVFWFSDLKHVTAKTYVSATPYDMASCLAMFTSISVTVIFIVQIETNFSNYYREYTESVIGGTYKLIEKAKKRMFRMLGQQIINIVQTQFIISMILFLMVIIFLPKLGMGGKTMTIYPSLAAAYFIIFIMYCNVIFLYYFDDQTGSLITTAVFCAGVLFGSLVSRFFPAQWYGLGAFFGAMLGWLAGYLRLMWMEKNLDIHIFCRGTVIPERHEEYPDSVTYDKNKKKVLENIAPDSLISIVIPVYNRSMELYYCVESIEKQTYRHFEILILDSGSTDNTKETCEQLHERYANVRVFHLEKSEIGVIRNIGLTHAKGQYIMFVDSDDELYGEKALFHLIVKAVKTDADIVFGNYKKRIGNEEYLIAPHGFTEGMGMDSVQARFQGFFSPRHLSYVWGKLYKKSFLIDNQLVFPKASYAEDKFFNITCYEKGASYAWIQDEIYLYVQNEKAVTSKYKADMKEIWFQFIKELEQLLSESKRSDKDLELLTSIFAIALNAREEYNFKNKKLSAVLPVIRAYRSEKRIDRNIKKCLFNKQIGKLPQFKWRFLIRSFSLIYCIHFNLLLAMGIRFLSDFGLDQSLTGESMKWEDKSLDEWETL